MCRPYRLGKLSLAHLAVAAVIAQFTDWAWSKEGRQRKTLQTWLSKLMDAMHGRIHGFAVSAACVWTEQEHLLEWARASECPWRMLPSPPRRAVTDPRSSPATTKTSGDRD